MTKKDQVILKKSSIKSAPLQYTFCSFDGKPIFVIANQVAGYNVGLADTHALENAVLTVYTILVATTQMFKFTFHLNNINGVEKKVFTRRFGCSGQHYYMLY